MNLLDEALRDSLTKREKGMGKESDLYRSADRKILSNSMVGNIKVMREYPTNLTDKQWKSMKNLFEPRERHRKKSSPRDFVYPTVHNKNGGANGECSPEISLRGRQSTFIFEIRNKKKSLKS